MPSICLHAYQSVPSSRQISGTVTLGDQCLGFGTASLTVPAQRTYRYDTCPERDSQARARQKNTRCRHCECDPARRARLQQAGCLECAVDPELAHACLLSPHCLRLTALRRL